LKLSPALMDTNRQATSSGEVQFTPSKLVAVVSPQRRSQTEKKVQYMFVKPVLVSGNVMLFVTSLRHLLFRCIFTH
jgi:hypothetical protein